MTIIRRETTTVKGVMRGEASNKFKVLTRARRQKNVDKTMTEHE